MDELHLAGRSFSAPRLREELRFAVGTDIKHDVAHLRVSLFICRIILIGDAKVLRAIGVKPQWSQLAGRVLMPPERYRCFGHTTLACTQVGHRHAHDAARWPAMYIVNAGQRVEHIRRWEGWAASKKEIYHELEIMKF